MLIDDIEMTYFRPGNMTSKVRAYWVPIALLDAARQGYADAGIKVRCRFRGPRAQSIGREMKRAGSALTYRRCRSQAMQDCLRADATHFTVYER